jgi:hypothetical protein
MSHPHTDRTDQNQCRTFLTAAIEILRAGNYRIVLTKVGENSTLIDRHHVNRGHIGFHDPKRRFIYLDYRYEFIVALIHELMHAAFPGLSEEQVIETHEFIMRHITPRQIKELLRLALPLIR